MSQSKHKIRWSNLINRLAIFPLLFTVMAVLSMLLILMVSGTRQYDSMQIARASQAWPSTDGVIIEADVICYRLTRRGDFGNCRPNVEYQYLVGGQIYTEDRVHFSDGVFFDTEVEARAEISNFRSGMTVRVYYDPDDPANATLMRTYKLLIFDIVIFLGIGALAALFAYWTYWLMTTEAGPTQRSSRLPP